MIQTQILTSSSSVQQNDTQSGFQVHKAKAGSSESGQQAAQTFRTVSRQQNKQSQHKAVQQGGATHTDQHETATGQTEPALQAGQAGFHSQEQATLSQSFLSQATASGQGQQQKQSDPADGADTSGIAAILSNILNAQQQRLSKAEQESHAHSNRISAKLAATTGEQNLQLKGQETTATTASDKLSQLTQADKLPVTSAALSQTDKVALKSVLMSMSATEGQATPSTAVNAALQSLSTSATQTQHTAGTANPASAGGAEWAAVRVDPQSGKWG